MSDHYLSLPHLELFYQVIGEGHPLVLLHGAFGTNDGWFGLLPTLSPSFQVIAVELQGHGHTADCDRPLDFRLLADDIAALLDHLGLAQAAVFGYSMGGGVALALASRHPERVARLVVLGTTAGAVQETYEPASYQQMQSITPETFQFPQVKDPYLRVAPHPENWNRLVEKIVALNRSFEGFSSEELTAITAPTLILQGDRDGVRPEHAVWLFRQLANAQLGILPGADHFLPFLQPERVLAPLLAFLQAN